MKRVIVLPVNATAAFDRGTVGALASAPTVTALPGNQKVTLSWSAVTGATKYRIYYDSSSSVTTSDTRIETTSTSYEVTGLTNGVTYYFRVSTVNAVGEGSLSSEVSAQPSSFSNASSCLFDGVDEYAEIGTHAAHDLPAGDWAISVWLKRQGGVGVWQAIYGKDGPTVRGFYASVETTNKFQILYSKNGSNQIVFQSTTATFSSTTTWYHVVFQKRSSAFEIYVNAASQALDTLSGSHGTPFVSTQKLRIGARDDVTNPRYFNGYIDEVSQWDKSFTSSEVTELYNSGLPTNLATRSDYSSCKGWWRMGEASTYPTINDETANAKHATMTNMESGDITSTVPS